MHIKFFSHLVSSCFVLIFFSNCSKEDLSVTTEFDVVYQDEYQNTIYPSMIMGFSELEKQEKQPMNYFTITVASNLERNYKIVIQESKLNFETVISQDNVVGSVSFHPSIKWKYDELKNLTQPGNVDLTFICYGENNNEIARKDIKFGYRSINECVLAVMENNEPIPLYFMIAAYVNEDSPNIDGFLKNVLDNTSLSSFNGYQGDEDNVVEQVEAIYGTMHDMGVKYSNITNTSNTNSNIISQYIRFSNDVLNNSQANCADGTVFFCSVLQKIGIHSFMVFVPGHVYLGYYVDDQKTKFRLLETTLVGSDNWFNMGFNNATNINVVSFEENIDNFNNDDYFDGYFIIDIEKAREFIKPIGLK